MQLRNRVLRLQKRRERVLHAAKNDDPFWHEKNVAAKRGLSVVDLCDFEVADDEWLALWKANWAIYPTPPGITPLDRDTWVAERVPAVALERVQRWRALAQAIRDGDADGKQAIVATMTRLELAALHETLQEANHVSST